MLIINQEPLLTATHIHIQRNRSNSTGEFHLPPSLNTSTILKMKLPIIIAYILLITTTNASTSNNRGVRRLQEDTTTVKRRVSNEPATIDSRRRLSKGSKSSATLTTRPTTITRPTVAGKASKASSKAMKIQTTSTVTAGGSDAGVAEGFLASAIDKDIEEMSLSMPMFVPAEELTDVSMSMYEPATIDSRRRLSKGSKSSATLTTRPTTITRPTVAGKASKASSKAMKIQTTSTVTAGGSDAGVAEGFLASAIDIDIEEMSPLSMPMFVPAEEVTDLELLSIEQDENSLSMSMLMVEEK